MGLRLLSLSQFAHQLGFPTRISVCGAISDSRPVRGYVAEFFGRCDGGNKLFLGDLALAPCVIAGAPSLDAIKGKQRIGAVVAKGRFIESKIRCKCLER